jgi:hypothetical protein
MPARSVCSLSRAAFTPRARSSQVQELSANGIIVISAIGNDGPLYGTLNNPADQMDVIGVGGILDDGRVAPFSSRGMTTWELPDGYGRVKPDVVTFGKEINGPRQHGGCRMLSGTSVASPVVAGVAALLMSVVAPSDKRAGSMNPAMMKQALTETAVRVPEANVFEQGMGKVSLAAAVHFLRSYKPHASAIPPALNLTDCPYMWPYCRQGLYHTGAPVHANLTVLNPLGVSGAVTDAVWVATGNNQHLLDVTLRHADVLWPWSGWLSVTLTVKEDVEVATRVDGIVRFTVVAYGTPAGSSVVEVPVHALVVPTPPRARRVLWDQHHSLRYPSGYFPRDDLDVKGDMLDWNGDHLHTNFRDVYDTLRAAGYFVEVRLKRATDLANQVRARVSDPGPRRELLQRVALRCAAHRGPRGGVVPRRGREAPRGHCQRAECGAAGGLVQRGHDAQSQVFRRQHAPHVDAGDGRRERARAQRRAGALRRGSLVARDQGPCMRASARARLCGAGRGGQGGRAGRSGAGRGGAGRGVAWRGGTGHDGGSG